MRKPKRIPKIRVTPYGKLLKQADTVFSKWIRNRDGWVCICCGSTERIQCGHFVPRGRKSVRFSEVNCNAQCADCNWAHNYNPARYTLSLHHKYDLYTINNMLLKSETKVTKIPRSELEDIIKRYS